MRQIILLPFILFFSVANGQCLRINDSTVECVFSFLGLKSREQASSYRALKTAKDAPIYIVDGVITNEAGAKKISPDDIEDISILKKDFGTAIHCNPVNDVIIITTKKTDHRTIEIKDIENNEPLPAASVELIYGIYKKDTIRFLTDSFGFVQTNKIVSGKEYELRVSSVGYKTYSSSLNAAMSGKNYSVALERNYLEASGVVVVSGAVCILRHITIFCGKDSVTSLSGKTMRFINSENKVKIYPNPVLRSQEITIEFENKSDSKVTIRVFSLDNKRIDTKKYHAREGMIRINYFIDARLASGIYIIQLIDESSKLIKTEKLIVQ